MNSINNGNQIEGNQSNKKGTVLVILLVIAFAIVVLSLATIGILFVQREQNTGNYDTEYDEEEITEGKEEKVEDEDEKQEEIEGLSITFSVSGDPLSKAEMQDVISILQRRAESYSMEASVEQKDKNSIQVFIPEIAELDPAYDELGNKGEVQFVMEDGSIALTNADIMEARGSSVTNQITGVAEYVVEIQMNEDGTEKFKEATEKAMINHEMIYIYFDDEIVSAPVVQTVIANGNVQITGINSYEEAQMMASFLRCGSIPYELEITDEKIIKNDKVK